MITAEPNQVFPIGHPESKGPESHIITAYDGLEMIKKAGEEGEDWNHIKFHAEAIQALLSQPGTKGLGVFKGHNGFRKTAVLFAMDENGQKIVGLSAVAIENGEPCPPRC